MIFHFLFRQKPRHRPRNGLRVRDNGWTGAARAFASLCADIDRGQKVLPRELRDRIQALVTDHKRMRRFRLMSSVERKRAGLNAPRVLVEPSEELTKVMRQVDEYLAKPQSERNEEIADRECRVRAAVGLASNRN